MKPNRKAILTFAVCSILLTACVKDFLDVKRDKGQVIPESLADFRALFENNSMNYFTSHLLGEVGSDDYYILPGQWQSLTDPVLRNAYVWADDIYEGAVGVDWNRGYEKILYANFVLEGANKVAETVGNQLFRNELIGAAYFFRGKSFFHLSQLFCEPYDHTNAAEKLGLPLKLNADINEMLPRATLEETYRQLLEDLNKAVWLLPAWSEIDTRPSKAAAYGYLSKVYLQLGDYQQSYLYADSALAIRGDLLDYNEIDADANLPFPLYGRGNTEMIFYSQMPNANILTPSRLIVDSVLYNSYADNDIRKRALFREQQEQITFKGFYSGITAWPFSGLTTAEMLLTRAESAIRLGNSDQAIKDLVRLLSHRIEVGSQIPIPENISEIELLRLVLLERRKELLYRGVRWHDLRRFKQHDGAEFVLERKIDGVSYQLESNSPKWVWPIPPDVVSFGKVMQNPR